VIRIDKMAFFHIKVDEIYMAACTEENCNATLVFQFLYSLAKIFHDYFAKMTPSSVRDHFVLVYEILDECIDHGYPQFTGTELLRELIKLGSSQGKGADGKANPRLKNKLTSSITGVTDWRPDTGIVYEKNEVFIDALEHVNLLLSTKGGVLRSDVTGSVIMKTRLSGMPQCKFGLNDKVRLNKEKTERKQQSRKVHQ